MHKLCTINLITRYGYLNDVHIYTLSVRQAPFQENRHYCNCVTYLLPRARAAGSVVSVDLSTSATLSTTGSANHCQPFNVNIVI